jgi:nucleoside-diphosphate-sugar epimerase
MNLETARISILGTGWLGQPLAQQLKQTDYQLKLATRSSKRFAQLSAINNENVQIDLDSLTNYTEIMHFLDTDILVINITYKNLENYQRFVELIEQSNIKHVLFVSSTSVYKNTQSVVTESAEFEDENSVVLQIENVFRNGTNFTTTCVRMAGLVDARRHPARFFKSGKTVPQAAAPINLIHLDDCIGVLRAVIEQNAWGEVFNACSTTHPDKREFYSYVRRLVNEQPPTFDDETALHYKIVSNDKIKQQLAYKLIHPDLMQCDFK